MLTLAQVDPGDYSPIAGGPLIEPCPVCGGQVIHYVERYQARQARAREPAAFQVLPGAIPVDEATPAVEGLLSGLL